MNVVGSGAQLGDEVAWLYQTRAALRTIAGERRKQVWKRFEIVLGYGLW